MEEVAVADAAVPVLTEVRSGDHQMTIRALVQDDRCTTIALVRLESGATSAADDHGRK
jgi:hypothetical protein